MSRLLCRCLPLFLPALWLCLALTALAPSRALSATPFTPMDVFELEWAEDPQISPDGSQVLYRRAGMDAMRDQRRGSLWLVASVGNDHRKLTGFAGDEASARWSPDGTRIAYVRRNDGEDSSDIHVHWLRSGQDARITRVSGTPSELTWSPDGEHIAFTLTAAEKAPQLATLPEAPEGAEWAPAARVTDRLYHERDGSGYIEPGYSQIFVVPAEGGTARQVSSGRFHHRHPAWAADADRLFVSANRNPDWEYEFRSSHLYAIDLDSGDTQQLTSDEGPALSPLVSPDGRHIAWLGFSDRRRAYQHTELRVASLDASQSDSGSDANADSTLVHRRLGAELDRGIDAAAWAPDSRGLYVQYEDQGRTRIAYLGLNGKQETRVDNVGGTSIGRPYPGGSFSVSGNDRIAYTSTRPEYPADVALLDGKRTIRLTRLNADLLAHRTLGRTESIRWQSSADGREIQGWLITPPDFDPDQRYPLLVENHGGPILNYGERFSPELQLYAAAGYVVFYPNPRGSTGYGEAFADELYHNYPGEDYDDIMSGIDAVLERGFIDEERLYVTGGSAGGIMSAWMIGKSDRFRAAAVVKPVMNWYSKLLNADNWFQYFGVRYPGLPWTHQDDYMRFSPISLVGDVNTPTLVMVGLEDLRTPPSQAKQLYHALKWRRVDTLLVELPEASHFIAKRPSQMIGKVLHILAWFERYGGAD
jgi:dipeptidyl aminopeptidase/acylaminoacyl peptidase